jgi:hypothetical protein
MRGDLVRPPVEEPFDVIADVLSDADDVFIVQLMVSPSVKDVFPDALHREPLELAIEFDVDPDFLG